MMVVVRGGRADLDVATRKSKPNEKGQAMRACLPINKSTREAASRIGAQRLTRRNAQARTFVKNPAHTGASWISMSLLRVWRARRFDCALTLDMSVPSAEETSGAARARSTKASVQIFISCSDGARMHTAGRAGL